MKGRHTAEVCVEAKNRKHKCRYKGQSEPFHQSIEENSKRGSAIYFNYLFERDNLLKYVARNVIDWQIYRSAYEHLLWKIKTIVTKCYWSAILRKIKYAFFTGFLTVIISLIIMQSEFNMNSFSFQHSRDGLPWQLLMSTEPLQKGARTDYKKLSVE